MINPVLCKIILQLLASAFGTMAFAVLFSAPRCEYALCAMNGAVGWGVYLIFMNAGATTVIASLFATLVLTILARIFAALRKKPVTVFLVTGIFPLVPGAGIYYTSYYLIMNDLHNFSVKGTETFKVAGAIVLGIIFGFGLPQIWFNSLATLTKQLHLKHLHRRHQ